MRWLVVLMTVVGLVSCQETETETDPDPSNGPIVASFWDCSQDHRPDPDDPRRFQQSAGLFAEGAAVFGNICPTQLLEFYQDPAGPCECRYIEELRLLLLQECQIRVPPNAGVDEYDLLIPNLDVNTIEELYVRQSCSAVLPANVNAYYAGLNIIPLFFNATACACQYTAAALDAPAPPLPEGNKCEALVDFDLNTPQLGTDFVGNWFSVFPYFRQNNVTNTRGGAAFGADQITSAATWRLAGTSFVEINLVARFQADGSGGGDMVVFSNECRENQAGDGVVSVLYNPSGNRFTVRFFSEQTASCSVGGTGVQGVQLYYNRSSVSLSVNGVNCDISSLNPITAPGEERIMFNSECPMQLGGRVLSNVFQDDFGAAIDGVTSLRGSFVSFLALRNCDNPPLRIVNRIQGLAN